MLQAKEQKSAKKREKMTTTSDNSFSNALLAKHVPGPRQGQWTYNDYREIHHHGYMKGARDD
jgi:hypothetical protein